MKHTPGPWWVSDGTELLILARSADPTLEVEPVTVLQHCSITDARLIAAAPELLSALKATEVMLADWARKDLSCEFLLTLIRPAIAKAEGK